MSRKTAPDTTELFRAVVVTKSPTLEQGVVVDIRETTAYYGPYATAAAAKGAATREGYVSPYNPRGVFTESKIQRTSVVWEDVES